MPFWTRKMTPPVAITLAFALLTTVPLTNPLLDVRGEYQFFTTTAVTTAPTVATNRQIYASPTGNDTTGNGTIGTPYLTLERCWTDVSNLTDVWVITLESGGTYPSTLNALGHVVPTKNMASTGAIYVVMTGATLTGDATSAATLTINTSCARIYFIGGTIGDGTLGITTGTVNFVTTTNLNNIIFEGVTISGGTGFCVYYNNVSYGTWRASTYIGDHAFKRCTFNTAASGFVWRQSTGGSNPLVGVMIHGCGGTYGAWQQNRTLFSKAWITSNTFAATASGCHAFVWGTNSTPATAFSGANTCMGGYIANNTFSSVLGHAVIIGDNTQNFLFESNTWTCGGGVDDVQIQGAVFKNATNFNVRNNTGSGNTGSTATNNAILYMKGCTGWAASYNTCTATTNGIAFHISGDSARPSTMGTYYNNTFTATGAATAKCVAWDGPSGTSPGGTQYVILEDNNTYTFTGGAVLTGSLGVRGVVCATGLQWKAAMAASLDTREMYNGINSVFSA